jgi:hypothetical protein
MLLNKTQFPNHFARGREVFHVLLTTFGRTTILHFFYCVCIIVITWARGKLWCNKNFYLKTNFKNTKTGFLSMSLERHLTVQVESSFKEFSRRLWLGNKIKI